MTVEQLSLHKYERSRKYNKVADNSKSQLKTQIMVMCINNVTTNSTQTLGGGDYILRCGINKNKFIVIKILKVQTRTIKETET